MTTFMNKLFGKNKKKTSLPLDPHAERYLFEYSQMASVSEYGIATIFTRNEELFYDYLKSIQVAPELVSSLKMQTYNVKEGEIVIFTFPDPEDSPEVKYAICIFRSDVADKLYNIYDYSSPYYILTRMVDVWAIGEIKPSPKDSNCHVTTYYKTIDSPDLLQFIKWVMEREKLSADHSEDIPDPIAEYLDRTF